MKMLNDTIFDASKNKDIDVVSIKTPRITVDEMTDLINEIENDVKHDNTSDNSIDPQTRDIPKQLMQFIAKPVM